MASRLGEMLVTAKLVTKEQLEQALQMQKKQGGRLGSNLVQLGFIEEEELTEFLSEQYGVPSINLSHFDIDPAVLKLVPADVAKKYLLIPLNRTGATLTIAMADPSNVFAMDDIKFLTGYHVEPVVASEASIKTSLGKYYGVGKSLATIKDAGMDMMNAEGDEAFSFSTPGSEGGEEAGSEDWDQEVGDFGDLISGAVEDMELVQESDDTGVAVAEAEDAPIIKLVNGILFKAIKMGVSDIHFEPYEKAFRVRYRLDGVLHQELGLPLEIRNAITSRVKIMANLDIAERRLPQDGRIKIKYGKSQDMDFRVSCLPCLFGEKIVLRLLDKSNLQLDMTKLGFDEKQLADFQEAIHKPYGMVLVTGPTGSGKTTTLYSALNQLNKISENIMTAEDPVEFNLAGINQVQMRDNIGLNFASALRSFLRQDPDIIMVGEIRDFETAEIAVKAALTGHLVLSTLHTNDAPSTINRLLNMGIEPFLVSSSVILILAQRLARKLCQKCKEPIEFPPEALIDVGFSEEESANLTIYKGKGCSTCANKGYKGRIALYEVLPIDDPTRELIVRGASSIEIKEYAREVGMYTLRDSGLTKIREGVTSVEEVLKVTFGN
ncbi:type IV-A pilus assembly ATPase PilB [bacterium]|nr:type IV-A pilus assembly ATPase PilB [bacterium]